MKGATKGTSFNDRQLAGQVRSMALEHLKIVLSEDYKDKAYQKQMLLKLSSSLLPRLAEVTGEDGRPIQVKFDDSFNATPSPSKKDS